MSEEKATAPQETAAVDDNSNTPDIYGQVHPVESPELLKAKLEEFEENLTKIPDKEKKCYVQAQEKCPQLVTDDFKLKFLRCEVMNADLAARRFTNYWEKRVEIFGPEKAFQPLTLKEALKDDHDVARYCPFTLLPTKDATGRSIMFGNIGKLDKSKYTVDAMARCTWYNLHAAVENEEAQKQGVVFVMFPKHAKLQQVDRKLMKRNMESIRKCLPVRVSALHACHPPAFMNVILEIMRLFMGKRLRQRVRVHAGSDEKVLEELEKYGIAKEALPTELGGSVVVDTNDWFEKRLAAGL